MNKDKIIEILKANRDSYLINDDMKITDPIILEKDFEKIATEILNSIQPEGEVVSEGKVEYNQHYGLMVDKKPVINVEDKIGCDYEGKNIQIIIREAGN